ncbi:Protein ACTIVITY OF BC1 COMPLEX KINASE 7 [Vigna angularis]|nr:Protein ACTIVITY OF BC1 COMPLEX KINASE 7 [Vigna angularis]
MAMQGCYCHHVKLVTQRRTLDSLSFSGSISVNKLSKNIRTTTCDPSKSNPFPKFLVVRMRQTELPLPASKNGAANGRAVKMVRTTELVNRKTMSANKVEKTVNGSASKVNGTSQVRKRPMPVMTKTVKSRTRTSRELPSLEELKVLSSDEGFSWGNEHYSSWQRSIDVWSFVVSFRIRILLDNSKWAYMRGFTEAKQLGPTFIKLGQLSSTMSDLFPREFVDELVKLQVHRAILHNGEKVVVKVQRPGLKKLFDIDLKNLKLIAEYFQRNEAFGGPLRDWIGIYEECAT